MFERFSDGARKVIVLAQDEARGLGHRHIGAEHVLLGLLREDEEGTAADVLGSLGISIDGARAEVVRSIGRGPAAGNPGQLAFTPNAKRTLEDSLEQALSLGQRSIGPEHLLLGLVRHADGAALAVLKKHGAGEEVVRQAVIEAVRDRPARGVSPDEVLLIHVRRAKQAAIDAQLFEVATSLREIERKLHRQGPAANP